MRHNKYIKTVLAMKQQLPSPNKQYQKITQIEQSPLLKNKDEDKNIKIVRTYQLKKNKQMEEKVCSTFLSKFQLFVSNVMDQIINQIFDKTQYLFGIQTNQITKLQTYQHAPQRFKKIIQIIYMNHMMTWRIVNNQKTQAAIQYGKAFIQNKMIPLYINIKAVTIVTWGMFILFFKNKWRDVNVAYQQYKNVVIIFVKGSFTKQKIAQKIYTIIGYCQNIKTKLFNDGLQITISSRVLLQKLSQITLYVLALISSLKQSCIAGIIETRKKSKTLYEEVICKIRSKQLQIRTNMKIEKSKKNSILL